MKDYEYYSILVIIKGEKMRHIFIINPASGKDEHKDLEIKIQSVFKKQDYEIVHTEYKGHAKELAEKYASSGEEICIYACGGDGTLNEVVNGMYMYPSAKLAIIPVGTGNDFIKCIKGYEKKDFLNLEGYLIGVHKKVDLLKIDDSVSINITNIGLDVEIVEKVTKFKRIPLVNGSAAYIMALLYCFFSSLKHKLQVIVDEKDLGVNEYTFVVAANGTCYGGGFTPCPNASLDDGYIDVCLVKNINRRVIARLIGKYKAGTHTEYEKYIEMYRVKKIQIKSDSLIKLSLDGEVIEKKDPIVEILDKKVTLFLPYVR